MLEILHVLPNAIPSPEHNTFTLTIHYYAVFILVSILLGWWISNKRYCARGGDSEVLAQVAIYIIIFGILGARIYHLITSPQAYFGPGGNPVAAFYIWRGGIGIWGAVMGASLAAWLYLRSKKLPLSPLADAIAPTLLLGQAIGRLGNYFNQELFGGPTTLPWGIEIDAAHLPPGYPPGTLFHPTFLYEMIWNLLMLGILLWAERKWKLGGGRVFWLYVSLYTAGRTWIEMVRIDDANHILGIRVNVWVSIIVFIFSVVMQVFLYRRLSSCRHLPADSVSESCDTTCR